MECIYDDYGACTNTACPMCGDPCPVLDVEGLCKYEERKKEKYTLTPKGCFIATITSHISLDEDIIDFIWHDFVDTMTRCGYIEEEE
jgi:hypothetical protein